MMTINEIHLNRPTVLMDFFVIFCFFRLKLFPVALRFSAEILSPYGGIPSQSGSLEFVVSPWWFCWTICIKKWKFSVFLCYQDFFCIQSSGICYWCIHLFHFFNFNNKNVFFHFSLRNDEFSLCLSEFGRYSTGAPNGTIGPLNGCPKRLS